MVWIFHLILVICCTNLVTCNYGSLRVAYLSQVKDGMQGRVDELREIIDAVVYLQEEVGDAETLVTPQCISAMNTLANAAGNGELWALGMLDSWGSPQPGLFTGDNYWEGHWDQCTDIPRWEEDTGVQGLSPKYCNVEWQSLIPIPIFKDGIALCLPDVCTENDFLEILDTAVNATVVSVPLGYTDQNPNNIQVYCPLTMNQKRAALAGDPQAIAAMVVLLLFVLLALIGSLYDMGVTLRQGHRARRAEAAKDNLAFHDSSDPRLPIKDTQTNSKPNKCEQILLSFSVPRHLSSLLSFRQSTGSITCLHGLRVLTFGWIVVGHAPSMGIVVSAAASTLGNRLEYVHIATKDINSPITFMNICVETFFIVSAMLNVISFLKKLENQTPNCEMMGLYFFHRFWRLTPVYMMILMFYTCLYPYLGAGPWYRQKGDSAGCAGTGSWWTNLLYLNNLIRVNGQDCMSWTWYMANDFQFYVFAPVLLFPLFYIPSLGIALICLCMAGGIAANAVLHHKWLVTEEQIENTWDIYPKPWTRCVTYFMGMLLGYLLHKTKFKVKIHPALAVFGWLAALVLIATTVYLPALDDDGWTTAGSAAWNSLRRPIYGLAVCWVIFACSTGYGGAINSILSWEGWLPFSKVSYVGYLVHPIFLFWYTHFQPFQIYVREWLFVFWILAQFFFNVGISIAVSVLYEAPFLSLERVMFSDLHKKKQQTSNHPPTTGKEELALTSVKM